MTTSPPPLMPAPQNERPVGDTALIASLLNFFFGTIGCIVGYAITRGKSRYEQSFGSLLLRAYLGSIVYSLALLLVLGGVGGIMAYNDRDDFRAVMKECNTVPAGTQANNSVVINTGSRTCELTDKGNTMLWDILSSYLVLAIPFIIFSIYVFYVFIRFIVASAQKQLYRPVITLGGKDLMMQPERHLQPESNGPFV